MGASNWSVDLSTTMTGVVNDSDAVTFDVQVTVPPIQMPLDSSEYNRAGDVLNVWVQASSK